MPYLVTAFLIFLLRLKFVFLLKILKVFQVCFSTPYRKIGKTLTYIWRFLTNLVVNKSKKKEQNIWQFASGNFSLILTCLRPLETFLFEIFGKSLLYCFHLKLKQLSGKNSYNMPHLVTVCLRFVTEVQMLLLKIFEARTSFRKREKFLASI